MKLTTIFLIAGALHCSAKAFSQKINLNETNSSLESVLGSISQQSGYVFFYDSKDVKNKKVTVKLAGASLSEALEKCLENTLLSYKLMDKTIILQEKTSSNTQQKIQAAIPISGQVTDDKNLPLPGVTVKIKGSVTITVTDADGKFKIDAPNSNAVLVFSFIGFTTVELPATTGSAMNVHLVPDDNKLNEVVVVAYGTQKKVNLTGSVTSVSGNDLNWKPVGQVSTALQGMASGVTVTQSQGQPGSDQSTIRIRGIGTLNNSNPLVLVDGVQTDINNVDANDIASVSVLKDAAASSIYGVRAANGVILITTKRGANGKTAVTYSNYFGWQSPTRLSKFVGAQEFMRLANLMYTNSGSGAVYSDAQIAQYDNPNRDQNLYPDNYWLKKILTGSGFQQQHSLAVSGGGEKNTYRFSTNYFNQDGLIKNMNYDRLTVRLNTDTKITKRLDFSADISANISNQVEPQGVSGSAWYQFGQGAVANPLNVDKYTDGTWATLRGGQNPLRLQDEGGVYSYKKNLFIGNFKLNYQIIDGLTLTGTASDNYQSSYNSLHNKAFDYIQYDTKKTLTIGQNDITKQYTGYWFQNYQGLINYKKTFGKHNLSFLAGASRLSENYDYLTAYRKDIPDGDLSEINAGSANTSTNSGTATEYLLISYFGRFNYSYDDKYLFEANIRRDGSSRFPKGSNYGWFPSFSAGWNLAKEEFMQDFSGIQELKLRGSWGKLGNDNPLSTSSAVVNYPYQSTFSYNNSYPFGGTLNTAASQSVYVNNGLTWETTTMADIGFDLGILNNQLTFTFDYYNKNTDNILYALPIPASVGFTAAYQNAGSMNNKGYEFSVNYKGKIGSDFKYSVGGNISDVKNKITDLKGTDYLTTDNNNNTFGYVTGQPIGSYYGYQVEGIFQSAAQVASHAKQTTGTAAGDLIYKDQNGDGVIDSKDRVYLGSNIPRYTFGFNLSANYKGFDFATLLQGVGKVDVSTLVMERAPTSTDGNFKASQEDSWTPTNTDASYPRLTTSTQNYQASSFWIKSGSYLRVKSMQLGYNFEPALISKLHLSKLRFYVSGQNMFTFSKLPNDIDPESPNDNRYYPQVKTYTFGINANF
ncbi:TonB-dependent receptor [Mucilaginibacter paludis]|nr:TonB-dependent receptor [Mucilaginibacter paludis]